MRQGTCINSCFQLFLAILECIKCALASGELEDLAALFQERGGDVNPKLKQLVGQVSLCQSKYWQ
jgi:hypothetical protein